MFLKNNISLRNGFVASSIKLLDEKIAPLEKQLGRSTASGGWGGMVTRSGDGRIIGPEDQVWDAGADDREKEMRFSNENNWFLAGWWEHPGLYDSDFGGRFRMNHPLQVLVALFGLSLLIATLPGSIGTLLGVGYLLRGQKENDENARTCAACAVGLLPGAVMLLLISGLIGWAALSPPDNGACGLFAVLALVYLVLFAAVLGFVMLLGKTENR